MEQVAGYDAGSVFDQEEQDVEGLATDRNSDVFSIQPHLFEVDPNFGEAEFSHSMILGAIAFSWVLAYRPARTQGVG